VPPGLRIHSTRQKILMSRPVSFPLIGLLYFATDTSMPIVEFAHAAAERAFESILLPEHSHIPVSSDTPFPAGGELPDRYRRLLDPYISLGIIATQTNLKIGTCISLVAQHDPITLAKTIATLDFISQGRFSLGVGYGWNRAELVDHGHQFNERREVVREYVELMRTLWRDTEAEFRGDHVSLSRSWAWPKPVQQPSVPVLLGCAPTKRGYADIVRWADGWIPSGDDANLLANRLEILRSQWHEAGRSESGPIIWAMQSVVDDNALRTNLDRFHALGITQVVLDLQTVSRDDLLPILDRYAQVRVTTFS
jgi:probable F420-dependent oxidoreductase